jgi:hypothetical protein
LLGRTRVVEPEGICAVRCAANHVPVSAEKMVQIRKGHTWCHARPQDSLHNAEGIRGNCTVLGKTGHDLAGLMVDLAKRDARLDVQLEADSKNKLERQPAKFTKVLNSFLTEYLGERPA